jgi:hypothetical protein
MGISFYDAKSNPYGKPYGRWASKWWEWYLSIPKSINPVLDITGKYSSVNQPQHDIWFLAGKYADEDSKTFPNRLCTIPRDRSILFPVINCEANPLEYPELATEDDIIKRVSQDEDSIVKKECFVDGNSIPPQRIRSDPDVFELRIIPDNGASIKNAGTTLASADGYWVFLKPLSVGKHTISFRGSCEYGKLNSGADYRLDVPEEYFSVM